MTEEQLKTCITINIKRVFKSIPRRKWNLLPYYIKQERLKNPGFDFAMNTIQGFDLNQIVENCKREAEHTFQEKQTSDLFHFLKDGEDSLISHAEVCELLDIPVIEPYEALDNGEILKFKEMLLNQKIQSEWITDNRILYLRLFR